MTSIAGLVYDSVLLHCIVSMLRDADGGDNVYDARRYCDARVVIGSTFATFAMRYCTIISSTNTNINSNSSTNTNSPRAAAWVTTVAVAPEG